MTTQPPNQPPPPPPPPDQPQQPDQPDVPDTGGMALGSKGRGEDPMTPEEADQRIQAAKDAVDDLPMGGKGQEGVTETTPERGDVAPA